MAARSIVVVGASAGGVEALMQFVAGFRDDFAAPVLVVLHLPPGANSALPRILSRAGPLRAVHAEHDQLLAPGTIFVAPPDHHMVLDGDRVRLTRGPTVNAHRPAIDPLFFSAARTRGARAVGVVLSGTLDDGAAGLHAIKRRGGLAVVQDPEDALYDGMPNHAIAVTAVDVVLPAALLATEIARRIEDHAGTASRQGETTMAEEEALEAEQDLSVAVAMPDGAAPSAFACPDCGGVLWEVTDAALARFRCRVGHVYTPEGLSSAQSGAVDDALWVAFRALEEGAALNERLAHRAAERGLSRAAEQYRARLADAKSRAKLLRDVLYRGRLDRGTSAIEPESTVKRPGP